MISVIIPTTTGGFNHLTKLMPQLSLEKGIEIIVIDNDSRDGTTNYLGNYDVLYKVNKKKMNFSESNNYGANRSMGEYLLFLNNDTIIQPGFAQEMVNTFNADKDIGIVGCLIYTMGNPKRVQHAGVMFTAGYIPYELGLAVSDVTSGIAIGDSRVKSVREVPSVTAACMMVKRDVFFQVGGFDPEYINGWEDTDFVLRAREKGHKVWYTGLTHIQHFHFGTKAAGRFNSEAENRIRYENVWVKNGRARKVLKGFRSG
jgi:GT2 family glycosyltransferase